MSNTARLRFAEFEINPASGVLLRNGAPVRIGRQPFRALALLVKRAGEIVTREELRSEIWGEETHVDFEHGLNMCIRQIRAALGEDSETGRIIATCPREGYRLNVPVHRPLMFSFDRRRLALTAAAAAALTVGGYLMLDSIRDTAPVAGQNEHVEARSAVAESSTDGVLGDRPGLPFATNLPRWPTANVEAHAAYWRGRALFEGNSSTRKPGAALKYFERAVTLDPDFFQAHASAALGYLDLVHAGVTPTAAAARAREAARRARSINADSAASRVANAEVSYRLDRDWPLAEREFLRAIAVNPADAFARQRFAIFLHSMRRYDDALEQLKVAQELDPLSASIRWQSANTLFHAGRCEEALDEARRTLDLVPNYPWAFRTMGQCLNAQGKLGDAMGAHMKAGEVALGHLGYVYARAGRLAEARQVLAELMKQPSDGSTQNGVSIAFVYTGLGETAQALQWLRTVNDKGGILPFGLRVAPEWEPLRRRPEYKELLKTAQVAGT